jgi:hypothetical protein
MADQLQVLQQQKVSAIALMQGQVNQASFAGTFFGVLNKTFSILMYLSRQCSNVNN